MNGSFVSRRAAVFVLLGAALCSTVGCGASVCRDAWLGPDRARHFVAGFAIGAATSTLAGHAGWAPESSAALGLGTVASASAAKETIDLNGKDACWSWKDFAWDLLGGVVGTALGTAAGH